MGTAAPKQRAWTGPMVLAAITLAVFWKLASGQYLWYDHPDAVNQILPWFQFQAREWHAGRFPLWDPHHWGGQSLPGQVQPGVFYPLNWLLFLAPLRDGFLTRDALNWYFVAIHFLGALAGYALSRSLGVSVRAAIVGGVAYGLGGYMGSNEWPQMLNGASWSPVVLLFWIRAMKANPVRNAILAGGALGMSWLSGHHQAPVFTLLACLFCAGYAAYTRRSGPRDIGAAVVVLLAAMSMVGAVQILTAYNYGHAALRWIGTPEPVTWSQRIPYSVHERYSLRPEGFAGILIPNAPHGSVFLGAALLFLVLQGAVNGWSRWSCRMLVGLGAFGVLVQLGGYSVVHGVLYAIVPMVEKARSPVAAHVIVSIAVAGLAAMGLDSLAEDRFRKRASVVFLGFGAALWLVLSVVANLHTVGGAEYDRLMLAAAACVATGAAARLSPPAAQIVFLLLVVFENANVTTYRFRAKEQAAGVSALERDRDLAEFLRKHPVQRVSVDHDAVPYNFGDWFGFDELQGYAGVTANVFRSYDHKESPRRLGANYHIGKSPPSPDARDLFESRGGVHVYDVPGAMPRAWLQRDAGQSCSDPGPPERHAPEPRHVVVKVNAGCRGLLVVSDTWAAGWRATVDGVPAPLREVDGFQWGVVVDGGAHTVEFRYRPADVFAGAAVTLVGLAGVVATALTGRRARDPGETPPAG